MSGAETRGPARTISLGNIDQSVFAGGDATDLELVSLEGDFVLLVWQGKEHKVGLLIDPDGNPYGDIIDFDWNFRGVDVTTRADGGFYVYSDETITRYDGLAQKGSSFSTGDYDKIIEVEVSGSDEAGLLQVGLRSTGFNVRIYGGDSAFFSGGGLTEGVQAHALVGGGAVVGFADGSASRLYVVDSGYTLITEITSFTRSDVADMQIASLPTGDFVVVWSEDAGNDNFPVKMQFFNGTGEAISEPVEVVSDVADASSDVVGLDVAALDNGDIAVTWSDNAGLHVAQYTDDGDLVSQSVMAAQTSEAVVGSFSNGQGLVAWIDEDRGRIHIELVDFDGVEVSSYSAEPLYADSYGSIAGNQIEHADTQFDIDPFDIAGNDAHYLSYAKTIRGFSVGDRDFLAVVGGQYAVSVYEVLEGGNLKFAFRENINEPVDLLITEVDGNVFLVASDIDERGVFVFSVSEDGALTETSKINDEDLPREQWSAGYGITTAVVNGETFLFSMRLNANSVSSYKLDADGQLTLLDIQADFGVSQNSSTAEMAVAQVGGNTYLIAPAQVDNMVSIYAVADDGTMTLVQEVNDNKNIALRNVFGSEVLQIDDTTYVYLSGYAEDGISIFTMGADGALDHVSTVWGDGNNGIDGPGSLTASILNGQLYMFVASLDADTVSVFSVGADGGLTFETYIEDDQNIAVGRARSVDVLSVGSENDAFLAVTSYSGEGGFSLFKLNMSVGEAAQGGSDLQTGTAGSDTLSGDVGDNQIDGLGGNDRLFAGAGDDTLWGGDGNDLVSGDDGADVLFGGGGEDTLRGGAGQDTIDGGDGNDAIWAGTGDESDDVMSGGAGNDTLGGGAGSDVLVGGLGVDILFGGNGEDSLYGQEADTFTETSGNQIWAGDGDDLVFGAAGSDQLGGGLGHDNIQGNDGADIIYAGQTGDDTLSGGAGADKIFGGADNDVISGNTGSDTLYGGAGDDILYGNDGNDTLYGGEGDDTLRGSRGDDVLRPGGGNDLLIIEANSGNDTITGFDVEEDKLDLSLAADFFDLADVQSASSEGADGLTVNLGEGNQVLLLGVSLADLNDDMFVL
ncbi:MAG: beta-propeller fold lactonase family protein [Alphaproteobacteria bacterium]|nr:beta-propeller fold lactonase family protein [Alphaproteobacteria bacterium]